MTQKMRCVSSWAASALCVKGQGGALLWPFRLPHSLSYPRVYIQHFHETVSLTLLPLRIIWGSKGLDLMGIKQLPLIIRRLGNNPFCNCSIRHHGSNLATPLHLCLPLFDLHFLLSPCSFFLSHFFSLLLWVSGRWLLSQGAVQSPGSTGTRKCQVNWH